MSPSAAYFKLLISLEGKKFVKWKDLILQGMEGKEAIEITLAKERANSHRHRGDYIVPTSEVPSLLYHFTSPLGEHEYSFTWEWNIHAKSSSLNDYS